MSDISLAADGYPVVRDMPWSAHVYNRCSYPLHPCDNYRGEKYHRAAILRSGGALAPETPLIIVPHWQVFALGEWRWCPRCTRRNTQRLVSVKKLYEASVVGKNHVKTGLYRHPALKDWRAGANKLGGRFVTPRAQATFARQHAPPGMFWCTWAYHYVSLDDPALRHTISRTRSWCVYCYKRWGKFQQLKRFRQHKAQGQKDYQKFHELLTQITAAKRELADLRRLKEAVAQEIVALQKHVGSRAVHGYETATNSDILLRGEAMTAPIPSPERIGALGRARRDRRRAYRT